jgi:hypothetical protein
VVVVFTDASSHLWGMYILELQLWSKGSFLATLKAEWLIHWKEMYAVWLAVQLAFCRLPGWWFEFCSDNMMVVAYLCNGGGSDWWMTLYVWRIHVEVEAQWCGVYMARWVCGLTDNQEADFLLWWVDHDDWEISASMVQIIQASLGAWSINWFANQNNVKHEQFNSLCLLLELAGVDAFVQSWS